MDEERQDQLENSGSRREEGPGSFPPAAGEESGDVSLPLSARYEDNGYDGQAGAERSYAPPPPPEPEWKPNPTGSGFTARALTEGAMMIAIALLLAFIGNYVPVLNFVGQLLFPLPMAILVFRRGIKVGVVGSVALFGLSLTFLPLAQAIYMIVQFGALGLFLGYCYRRQKSPLFTLGFAALIAALGALLSLLLTLFISGLPVSSLVTEADLMVSQMLQMMQESGSLDTQLTARGITFEQFAAEAKMFVRRMLPAALILSSMFMTLVCYLVSARVLRRLRYRIPQLPPFSTWRMDWRFTWGLIVGLFMGWFGRRLDLSWMESLGDNISLIFGAVIFVCGVSLIIWVLKNSKLSLVFKVLIVVLLLQFFSLTMYLVVLLAVLDALRDLRPWFAARIDKDQRLRRKDKQ